MSARAEKTPRGWALSGTKRFVPWAHVANLLLIPARAPEGPTLFLVDPSASGLTLSPVQGMDPATRWVQIDMDQVPAAADAVLGTVGQAEPLLASLVRRGGGGAAGGKLGAPPGGLGMGGGHGQGTAGVGPPGRPLPARRPQSGPEALASGDT